MKRTCRLCKKALEPSRQTLSVADGICPSCLRDLLAGAKTSMQDFLDKLGVPVLMVDSDERVRLANRKALDFLRKDPASVKDRYAGDAIECIHAREDGGCGKTEHCRTCTIRLTVLDTHRSGTAHVRVPAYADIALFAEAKPVRFLISTEKVGELVMLRIDEVRDKAAPAVPEDASSS